MNDDKIDRYLHDRTAPPAEEVEEIEQALAPLRYDPAARPLAVPRRRSRGMRLLLAAAAALAAVAVGVAAWVWTWPSERGWNVVSGPLASMQVGKAVRASDPLVVRVARIGWMRVTKGSEVTLLSTRTNQHRLAMNEGVIHVSVWAPPRSLAFRTPSGDVIDFGCEFILRVAKERTDVEVVGGWVELDHSSGEVLVPGGASSHMTAKQRPTVPLFGSATPQFKSAMTLLDDPATRPEVRTAALAEALADARRRDVYSLLVLARRSRAERDALLVRAAALQPPRSSAVVTRARGGDDEAIDTWIRELPLPPMKGWLRNWRDRLRLRVSA